MKYAIAVTTGCQDSLHNQQTLQLVRYQLLSVAAPGFVGFALLYKTAVRSADLTKYCFLPDFVAVVAEDR